MVFGRMKVSRDFVLALEGSLPRTDDRTLTLNFDGSRTRQPILEMTHGMILGRYGADARIAEDISRSKEVHISGGSGASVTLPLSGTRATLLAIDECLDAIPVNAGLPAFGDSILPEHRLCEDKPSNGRMLAGRRGMKRQGHKLKVRNSARGDAIVKVRRADTGRLAFSFYVQRSEEAEVEGFSDGTYRVQFAYGDALTETCADFRNPTASEFDNSVTFATTVERTANRVVTQTTEFTGTLYAVTGGNAPTSTISQNDFLRD